MELEEKMSLPNLKIDFTVFKKFLFRKGIFKISKIRFMSRQCIIVINKALILSIVSEMKLIT